MFKIFLMALVVTLITSVTSYYVIWIDTQESLAALEQKTVARVRALSEKTATTNEQMGNLIRGSNNLINSYARKLNEVKQTLDSTNTHIDTALTEISSQQHGFSGAVLLVENQATSFEMRLASLENDLSSISIPLQELRVDLHEVKENLNNASQVDLKLNQIDHIEQQTPSLLSYSEPCPSTALNRAERLPRLKRELEKSTSTGTHDVAVKFDITKGGDLIIQGLESQTAPTNVLGAVRRYMGGLVFDSQGAEFSGCEALVKLEVS
jgi:hypothetical protein